MTASSSGAAPDAVTNRSSAAGPWSALDGDLSTAWLSGRPDSAGQWWQVDFTAPRPVTQIRVNLATGPEVGGAREHLVITTSEGSRDVRVLPTGNEQVITVGASSTSFLRIAAAPEPSGESRFGIHEVTIDGLTASRPEVLPAGAADAGLVLQARRGESEGCVASSDSIVCADWLATPSEERAGIDRRIDVRVGGTYRVALRVRPRPGSALDGVMQGSAEASRVVASSVSTPDPAGRAEAAFDGDAATTWVASALDPAPRLTVTFPRPTIVNGVRLTVGVGAVASHPFKVTVATDRGSRTLFLDSSGELHFQPTSTRHLVLTFPLVNPLRTFRPVLGQTTLVPVGVTELAVLGSTVPHAGLAGREAVTMGCGLGPEVRVDGSLASSTSVTEAASSVVRGELTAADPCGGAIHLAPGEHRIQVHSTAEWLIDSVALIPLSAASSTATGLALSASTPSATSPVASEARVIGVSMNANAGWHATLNGADLEPIRLDGWRQGFVVPAGVGGEVTLTYTPDRAYRWGLLLGLLAVIVLFVLAAVPSRWSPPGLDARETRWWAAGGAAAVALLVAGPVGLLIAGFGFVVGRRLRRTPVFVAGALLVGVGAQAVLPWPGHADAGAWYSWCVTLAPVLALGLMASRAVRHADDSDDSATAAVAQLPTN